MATIDKCLEVLKKEGLAQFLVYSYNNLDTPEDFARIWTTMKKDPDNWFVEKPTITGKRLLKSGEYNFLVSNQKLLDLVRFPIQWWIDATKSGNSADLFFYIDKYNNPSFISSSYDNSDTVIRAVLEVSTELEIGDVFQLTDNSGRDHLFIYLGDCGEGPIAIQQDFLAHSTFNDGYPAPGIKASVAYKLVNNKF